MVGDKATFDEFKKILIDELGNGKPHELASWHLASLKKGDLTCRELPRQARHLTQVMFSGTSITIQEPKAFEALLRALPATLKREVL